MSNPSTAAKLEFFDLPVDAPAPNSARARVDAAVSGHSAADPGPSRFHLFHGAIPLGHECELRISTQSARSTASGTREGARLVVRAWHQHHDGTWWPVAKEPGIMLHAQNVAAFAKAVDEAARHILTGEVKP